MALDGNHTAGTGDHIGDHNLLEQTSANLDATISSGFPNRKTGQRQVSLAQELAVARANATAPAGAKPVVLAESWGTPGILTHLWFAQDAGSAAMNTSVEDNGIIRIYLDDSSTPKVTLSVNDFFMYAPRCDAFTTPRVGRTARMTGQTGAYRYLYAPFAKYLRVEYECQATTDATALFVQASYSLLSTPAQLGTTKRSYQIVGSEQTAQAKQTPFTVCNLTGAGQIESLWVSVNALASGDTGVMEGNVEIYVDGQTYPTWRSSGMEDAFNGGWYQVPAGGYPAGRAGTSDRPLGYCWYRFFLTDPIFYSTSLRVVVWAGQPGQGAWVSTTVPISAFVGVWTDPAPTINYKAVDTVTTPALADDLNYTGALSGSIWSQGSGKTTGVGTGSSITVAYDSTAAGQDTRMTRLGLTLPTQTAGYWLETRCRITNTTVDGQEVFLTALGNAGDAYFGSGVHVELKRNNLNSWVILTKDGFTSIHSVDISNGRDLSNTWVRLALKVQGTTVTGYWRSDDGLDWQPIGSWVTALNGTAAALGTYNAAAEFDSFYIRPLATVTT